ncbi:transferase hexapeptide (six repeat-containing protein) [Arenibacter nanhaiticus]|uniref:Transferase hexapeptide (Six repeat-containing protein) n=1 Tax=Arenibacter nanhaiticus TaxID=558155 RepID=A0A1M6LYX9_9FLAO|nr:acyltransferase [Arenibacter nanhaiticus]SHJ76409.1 transferase hexapeptide (six repeat-containing protein) [Arenibacter nanhaiticus]
MNKFSHLYSKCKESNTSFYFLLLKYFYYKLFYNKNIFSHQRVEISGVVNIETDYNLKVGVDYVGFMSSSDVTILNIKGKLKLLSDYSIGRGCRFDIGENAKVQIGKGGYINANTKLIIMHGLKIGDNCIISWDCQFLDDDFHEVHYENKKDSKNNIVIGNKVWIGCGVKIYKGSVIPSGSIVAANSVVRNQFNIPNCIIAGHPAEVIKENVQWD